jgi:hypothetical protein
VSGPERSRVILQAYPTRDASFACDVGQALETVWSEGEYAEASALDVEAVVQGRLRARYPNATVHAQDPFARLRDPQLILYAYRDGRIRPEDPRRERLYRALAEARSTSSQAAAVMRDSMSVAARWARHEFDGQLDPQGTDAHAETHLVSEIRLPPRRKASGQPDRSPPGSAGTGG